MHLIPSLSASGNAASAAGGATATGAGIRRSAAGSGQFAAQSRRGPRVDRHHHFTRSRFPAQALPSLSLVAHVHVLARRHCAGKAPDVSPSKSPNLCGGASNLGHLRKRLPRRPCLLPPLGFPRTRPCLPLGSDRNPLFSY